MTVQLDLITLIVLVGAIVLLVFLVPMIRQMKRTARETDLLLSELRRELVPSLRDVREITERIKRASVQIEKGSGHAGNLIESLNDIAATLRRVSQIFGQDSLRMAENAACLMVGLKAAGRFFFKQTQNKGD
jgi:uncharacterized protein YoxC